MTEERDPYQVLGVAPEASDDEIRKAYHARARRLHPDVVGEAGLDDMRQLNQAWAVLKDPERRDTWDSAHGRARRPAAASGGGDGSGAGGPAGATPTGSAAPTNDFAGQPAWTGAAGRPPGRAYGSVLDFGIYAGWSLGEIARRDRGYLTWLRDRHDGKKYRAEIEKILESTAAQVSEAKDRKRR
ncbi:MAG TPA: J domain-containing protein [Candidatus Limnocylindrales bacterium]